MTDCLEHIIDKLRQEEKQLPDNNKEVVQHLTELGYIKPFQINIPGKKHIEKATKEFFREVFDSDLFTLSEKKQFQSTERGLLAKDLLRKATDIDEGFQFQVLPQKGDINLTSRIIHYRLEIFGYWHLPIESGFNQSVSTLMTSNLTGILECSTLETYNLMGNIEELTRRILSSRPEDDFIVTFKSKKAHPDFAKKYDRRRPFLSQLHNDFGEKNKAFKTIKTKALPLLEDKIDFNFLKKESRKEFNKLVMRILQVNLWQDGFYNGLLDGDIAEVSLKSLVEAVDFYNETNTLDIKPHRVITYIDKGYFLFNALFFLQVYMMEANQPEPGTNSNYLAGLIHGLNTSSDSQRTIVEQNINQLKKEIERDNKTVNIRPDGLIQRIYYGTKNLIRQSIKCSRKLLKWIINRIKSAWGFLKKLFLDLFEDLKNGIKYFLEGLSFFLGKKALLTTNNSGSIITTYQFGGDTACFIGSGSDHLLSKHSDGIHHVSATINYSITLLGGILKIVIRAINMLCWPTLLLTIANTFKEISTSFKNI